MRERSQSLKSTRSEVLPSYKMGDHLQYCSITYLRVYTKSLGDFLFLEMLVSLCLLSQ